MLYYKCPTCKTILANKELIYDQKLNEVCAKMGSNKKGIEDSKKQILDELQLENYCCRMRMLGKIRLVDIIK